MSRSVSNTIITQFDSYLVDTCHNAIDYPPPPHSPPPFHRTGTNCHMRPCNMSPHTTTEACLDVVATKHICWADPNRLGDVDNIGVSNRLHANLWTRTTRSTAKNINPVFIRQSTPLSSADDPRWCTPLTTSHHLTNVFAGVLANNRAPP